jgi:hypothetical protein
MKSVPIGLQAKTGELVMENAIRKEAMRPFSSV